MPARTILLLCLLCAGVIAPAIGAETPERLTWHSLPAAPTELGLGGPLVGVHHDALLLAGGANFAQPVWDHDKQWQRDAFVLTRVGKDKYAWQSGFQLDRPIGYAACASTPLGVACLGGNDGITTFAECFLLTWDPQTKSLSQQDLPSLPEPCAYGAAAAVGDHLYLSGGQTGVELSTATQHLWRLNLKDQARGWVALPDCPGPPRAYHAAVTQHNGFDTCVYFISGRCSAAAAGDAPPERIVGEDMVALADVWEFNPARLQEIESAAQDDPADAAQSASPWRRRRDIPQPMMAGGGAAVGQSHIFMLSGDDGRLMSQTDDLKLDHPGFPRRVFAYHTITDTWIDAGESPANQVTTPVVSWNGAMIVASGEVKPRVRTPAVWSVTPVLRTPAFGALNYTVLFAYLGSMVGVGVYFARRTHTTDDFFRGGKHIPWYAAGCSIFATMLSSLTFTGIPSKAYAQDWVYSVGNFMIPVAAVFAVYLALPFYRRIDATSAYEYLEQRFNRPARWFASASFTLFHLFRMAVVMSITGLTLAVATPLTPAQSVLLIGVLSILYSAIGGIEAVIWTDTLQTVVLLGGALAALLVLVGGIEGGWSGLLEISSDNHKLRWFNWSWDATNTQVALWVIVFGALSQHLSAYTADQAVVQRYMTTADERLAARSIWTNAVLAVPATVLFFGIGTALFAFYSSHPQKLDPTIATDQIFPLFIARELGPGFAGLIVAGVFAAAQSTVSTSMNSTSTTIITDFLRPAALIRSEQGYLSAARWLTVLLGALGTGLGLIFVDPAILSLFDAFIVVVGLFMGTLGGLFGLGVLTTRANGRGALVGAVIAAIVMGLLTFYATVNVYLYALLGLASCFTLGYVASFIFPADGKSLSGLTIYTLGAPAKRPPPTSPEIRELES